MPYTDENISHGTIRFATYPIDQWHIHLLGWNGGGLMLMDKENVWRMHKIQFGDFPANLIDIRDCTIEGVPHQNMQDRSVDFNNSSINVFDCYARDNDGVIEFDFSETRAWIINGFVVKQFDPHWMLIGRVGCLPNDGGIGYPGDATCAMCASYFQPEFMHISKLIGGTIPPNTVEEWTELVEFQNKLHFVCLGDGREVQVNASGLITNEQTGGTTFVGISKNGLDPERAQRSGGQVFSGGGTVPAMVQLKTAGWGDGAELYQNIGLKMVAYGGAGALPYGFEIHAYVWM